MSTKDAGSVVLTVGHSTRSLAEFVALLKAHAVTRLIDVRTVPRSRHNPQFDRDTLPAALAAEGIGYEHRAGLGGFRRTHPGSSNTGWRNLRERIALMCAEAVPWRCHRSLIADALVVHGLRVEEIISGTRSRAHALTPFARVSGATITYPPEAPASHASDAL